ncbi:MAG: hypothetical protein KDK70_28985 [Myxococcales bacterium]|nr:hypothetical protein [Myxococcales bacterium]
MGGPLSLVLLVATAPPAVIEWSAPASCPDAGEVERQLAALVPLEGLARGPGARIGRVHAEAEGFALTLDLGDGRPARRMRSADCSTLTAAAVLVLAIELDPLRAEATVAARARDSARDPGDAPPPSDVPRALPVRSGDAPPSSPVRSGDAPPSSPMRSGDARPASPTNVPLEPTRGPSEAADAEPHGPIQGLVRARAGLGRVGLPRVGPIVGGAVGLAWPRARVEALGELHPRQRITYPGEVAGADLRMTAGALRGCAVLHPEPVELPLCAGLWLAVLQGQGQGVDVARRDTDLWIGPELAVAVAWAPTPRLALRLSAEGTVAVRRPAFTLRDHPVLFRAPRAGARLMAGVELRFPAYRRTEPRRSGD